MKPKSAMDLRIEKLIDVYCTYVFGVDRDAGWHAPSQLEGLKDACSKKRASFQRKQLSVRVAPGEERQANDRADDKMINEVRYVRNKHYDFELAKMLFSKLEEKQLLALLAGRYLKYVYKRGFSGKEVAEYLNITIDGLRHHHSKAVLKMEKDLSLLQQYDLLRKSDYTM